MRVLQLNILAFGPFTGQTLQFQESDGLHVVHGPNEAGKSSSLRALRYLLYGIPHNCSDNFIYPNPSLRIGGVLQDGRGTQLEFIRRKGRDKTIRGADDVQVVELSELSAMLGGVDENSFCQRFGIGYQELRDGGQAIVDGEGELGAILFAAGAGLTDIRHVQAKIEAEMQELFKSGGSIPRINRALAELKAARDQIKEAQLPTAKWVEQEKALSAAKKRQKDIDRELIETQARKSLLERFQKALPLIASRKRVLEQHATVADAPLLPDDFATQRRDTVSSLSTSREAEQDAISEMARLKSAIAELTVPSGLLEHRSAIGNLYSELGSHRKASKDRPGLVALHQQAEQRAKSILEELDREPDTKQADQLHLSKSHRHKIHELAGECKIRFDRRSNADTAKRHLADEIERAEQALGQLDAARNADTLKLLTRRAQKQGDLDQKMADALAVARQLKSDAEVELKKLPLFTGSVEELEKLPVCASETVDRFNNLFADVQSVLDKSEGRIADLTSQIEGLDGKLEALRLAHDVPTEDDLKEARRLRDSGWDQIRRYLDDATIVNSSEAVAFIEQFANGNDLPQAFQASMQSADLIADRLRHEADRVAEKATLTAERSQRRHQLAQEEENLKKAQNARQRVQSQWQEQWVPLGISPLSPREMLPWLRQHKALADRAQAIRTHAVNTEQLSTLIASLRSSLVEQLRILEQQVATESSLSDILQRCDEVVVGIETASRKRADSEKKLDELRGKLIDAEEAATLAATDLQQWKAEWAAAVAVLGLTDTATPSEANSVIQSIDELLSQLKEANGLLTRIEGIDRDAEAFKQSVETLFTKVANDLLCLPVDQAVSDLYDRLTVATDANAKLDEWQKQLTIEEAKRDKAHVATVRLEAEIASMCIKAGCNTVDELPEAEQRSALRRKCDGEFLTVNRQLEDLASGSPLETFISESEAIAPDQLQAELLQLGSQLDELNRTKIDVAEAIGTHRNELLRMDGNGRAADAQCQAEHLLASIRADAEQYIRLRLAATILRRAIERFRESSQGPVVNRAGELFAEMTLGSFAGLRADYDDKGRATLVGVRAGNGHSVTVAGMSDGTCDQMYLALRLALLESHVAVHEPLPFIVDDILVQFDDDRAVASLKILAEVSKKTQVIFFTHHEHLVALAQRHLGGSLHFTHRLDCRARTMATV